MGRYNLAAQKVHSHISQLLHIKRIPQAPAWYNVVGNIPSSEILTRKAVGERRSRASRKASRLFQPVQLKHAEDDLRWEFFNDHPWELARPRVVMEDDGKDLRKWDWSQSLCPPEYRPNDDQNAAERIEWQAKQRKQPSRPINGEAVVQRQHWLMRNENMSQAAAYDKARKELYAVRHAEEVEQRVAREEAQHYGAQFHMGPLEAGMKLEDEAYENWREWAAKEIAVGKQVANSAYTGRESEEMGKENLEIEAEEVLSSIPGSKAGQSALGGAAIHP